MDYLKNDAYRKLLEISDNLQDINKCCKDIKYSLDYLQSCLKEGILGPHEHKITAEHEIKCDSKKIIEHCEYIIDCIRNL